MSDNGGSRNMKSNLLSQLRVISDERGKLVAVEALKNIPFEIKRVYYLYALNDFPRGFHAHKSLNQFMICVHGKVRVVLDDGREFKTEVTLDDPGKGVLIPPRIWHEMHDFSDDCVLVVFADNYYDESDYLRNYSDFVEIVNGVKQ